MTGPAEVGSEIDTIATMLATALRSPPLSEDDAHSVGMEIVRRVKAVVEGLEALEAAGYDAERERRQIFGICRTTIVDLFGMPESTTTQWSWLSSGPT